MENGFTLQDPNRTVRGGHEFHDKTLNGVSLAKARLENPDTINEVVTYLMGKEHSNFPLLFLTEGQRGGVDYKEINNVEFDYPVFEKLRRTDEVVSSEYKPGDEVGKGDGYLTLVFKTRLFNNQHTLVAPSGAKARIQQKGVKVTNGYKYVLQLFRNSSDTAIGYDDVRVGTKWSMWNIANVSESYSLGNESNFQTGGKLKNQIGILRKSFEVGGQAYNNTSRTLNWVGANGSSVGLIINEQEYQNEILMKEACEEYLWDSTYNRDINGQIMNICEQTGLPIPMGAGLREQIPNRDTFAQLTLRKFDSMVRDATFGHTDGENANLIIFTGTGGMEEINRVLTEASSKYSLLDGALNSTIKGNPMDLSFGHRFTSYRHIDGHTITFVKVPVFDTGARALASDPHPISGLPLTSYEMHFVDFSTYNGVRNVQIVSQKGRSMIRGIEQGMSLIKGATYGDYKGNAMDINLSTSQDKTSVHYLKTLGIVMYRNTKSFSLYCDAN